MPRVWGTCDLTFHVLADQQRVAAGPQAGAVELDNVAVVVQGLEDAYLLWTVTETPASVACVSYWVTAVMTTFRGASSALTERHVSLATS